MCPAPFHVSNPRVPGIIFSGILQIWQGIVVLFRIKDVYIKIVRTKMLIGTPRLWDPMIHVFPNAWNNPHGANALQIASPACLLHFFAACFQSSSMLFEGRFNVFPFDFAIITSSRIMGYHNDHDHDDETMHWFGTSHAWRLSNNAKH